MLCYKLNGRMAGGRARRTGAHDRARGLRVQIGEMDHARRAHEQPPVERHLRRPGTTTRIAGSKFARALRRPAGKGEGGARPSRSPARAQVGVGGVAKVQIWVHPQDAPLPADDPYFTTTAPWQDVEILPLPEKWAGKRGCERAIRSAVRSRDAPARANWPLRSTIALWATVLRDVKARRLRSALAAPSILPGMRSRWPAAPSRNQGATASRKFRWWWKSEGVKRDSRTKDTAQEF